MPFSKSFPKTTGKSNYPVWEEVYLTEDEEQEQEKLARHQNIKRMQECIDDAKRIMEYNGLKRYQSNMIHLAVSLFDKRGSHEIYFKENKAKEKFDSLK
jgi:hypothetical protein